MRNVVFTSMSSSATPATPATQNEGRCHQVPRLPHNMDVHVTKCHACHTKRTLPILTVTMVLPFRLLGVGGLGFTTVDGSGCKNVSYHVPIQLRPMVLRFKLLGGRLRFISFATTDSNNGGDDDDDDDGGGGGGGDGGGGGGGDGDDDDYDYVICIHMAVDGDEDHDDQGRSEVMRLVAFRSEDLTI